MTRRFSLLTMMCGVSCLLSVAQNNTTDSRPVQSSVVETNDSRAPDASIGEISVQPKQLQDRIGKLQKEVNGRQQKIEKLQTSLVKTQDEETQLNTQIEVLKQQPNDTKNLKEQNKLVKRLNGRIAKRQKIQRDLEQENSRIEAANQELTVLKDNLLVVAADTSVVVIRDEVSTPPKVSDNQADTMTAVTVRTNIVPVQPEISDESVKTDNSTRQEPDAMQQIREFLAANDGKSLVVGGNLIVGSNNVVIIVDDRQKASDIAQLLQGGKQIQSPPQQGRIIRPEQPATVSEPLKKSVSYEDSEDFYEPVKEKQYNDDNMGKVKKLFSESFFDHFSIGVKASTMGIGAEISTTLSRNLQFRLGYDWMKHDFKKAVDFKIQDPAVNAATGATLEPKLRSDLDVDYSNYHALIDIYPMRKGIFHITAGVYYGTSTISVAGQIIDGYDSKPLQLQEDQQWPPLYFADYKVPVDNGYVNTDVKLGNRWKPYLGIGLGRTISKSPVSFKFELGLLHQGEYKLMQDGTELPDGGGHADSFVKQDNYTRWLKFYPMVGLQINVRLW